MITEKAINLHHKSFVFEEFSEHGKKIGFYDPFTETPLHPDEIPRSIAEHPRLNAGLNYLAQRSHDMTLTIMPAPHAAGDVHNQRDLEQAFSEHDAIFFEGIGNTKDQRDVVWEVSAGNRSHLTDDEVTQFGDYGVRKLAALAGKNKPSFFADMSIDGDDYEKSLIEWGGILDTLYEKIGGANGEELEILNLTAGINLAAVTILREWYILANIGAHMKELDEQAGYKSNSPMLLIGKLHGQTLPTKLQKLGVNCKLRTPHMDSRGEQRMLDIPFDLVQALSHYAVTY